MGMTRTLFEGNPPLPTKLQIDIDLDAYDDDWDDYLIPDNNGKYFFDVLEWSIPVQSVFAFPQDSPQYFDTGEVDINADPILVSVYQRD